MTDQTRTRRSTSPFQGVAELSRALSGVTEEEVREAKEAARRTRRRVAVINRVKQYCGATCVLAFTAVFTTGCAFGVAVIVNMWQDLG